MVIFDQFETEPASSLSGSYTDDVVFGYPTTNLVNSIHPISGTRVLIGSRGGGKTSYFRGKKQLYSRILQEASGNLFGRPRNFNSFETSGEQYYDSSAASIVDYYSYKVENNNGVVYFGGLSGSVEWGLKSYADGSEIPGAAGFILVFTNKILWGGTGILPLNVLWSDTFPFESKYKTFSKNKLVKLTYIQPKKYTVTFDEIGNPISPVSSSNKLGAVTLFGNIIRTPIEYIIHPTSSIAITEIESGPFIPRTEITQFASFGFGRGSTDYDREILGIRHPRVIRAAQSNYYSLPVPLGWKYGLFSGIPINTSCKFRRGRFGNLRDMLEQRPYTKFSITDGNKHFTSTSPVFINFVSGTVAYARSIDYVTATNPDYDPRDTGFYHKEYAVGQPFFDG